ncbi:MAG: DUF6174 domain-containing protein [Solirubrobacteraceae bacterium]
MRRCLLLVVLLAIGLALARGAASHPAQPSPDRVGLDHGQARWNAQHLTSYRFRLTITCDCLGPSHRRLEIIVRRGRPPGGGLFPGQLQTFPEMFRLIRRVLDDPNAGGATVQYDPRRGFPRAARLDAVSWAVDHFQPV